VDCSKVDSTSLIVRPNDDTISSNDDNFKESAAKVSKAEQQYNFTFDFRGATSINLANFQLCNSSIHPSVSTNTTTSRESSTIVNALSTDVDSLN
jgi:hypothetical protein